MRIKHFQPLLLIVGLIVAVYLGTLHYPFTFDDSLNIEVNPTIKTLTWDNFSTLLKSTRPMLNILNLINYQICALNVGGWHIINILLHIANSFLVYLLVLQITRQRKDTALFVSLLFALHPIQTEAVTYIISRTELLASLFYLGAILLWSRGKHQSAIIAAIFAALSKEWAVTLPAIILLYDYLFDKVDKKKPYVLLTIPWAIVLYLIVTNGLNAVGSAATKQSGVTATQYLFTSVNVLWTGIRLLIIPINQNLDYSYPIAQTFPILAFIGHLILIGISIWLYKKKGWSLILFGVLFFYITISPVQSIVPVLDIFFEHRLYLPSIGFFIVFVAACDRIFVRGKT